MQSEKYDVLIAGGGPAGLRAAEILSAARKSVALTDRMPSVGRKFLVAGRGGLNLTHSEPLENFPARYGPQPELWRSLLADFSPADLRQWAEDLGVETFIGTSGRVFPRTKQAAPLLRRWIERLRKQGVLFKSRHALIDFQPKKKAWRAEFKSTEGVTSISASVLILAFGGASWPQTGSDGAWTDFLSAKGIEITPLAPANCGYEVDWPASFLAETEGLPLKNVTVSAKGESVAGELLITKYGLEGGALYQLGRALRGMDSPRIEIDLKPTFTAEQLGAKPVRAWKLSKVASALLQMHNSSDDLAKLAKSYPLPLLRPRPIEEAISTTGGVSWRELDEELMLRRLPGIFCAGEMIDWDAPTGGYLLQGCFSTATRAARGALAVLNKS